jgi:hypothetical protein
MGAHERRPYAVNAVGAALVAARRWNDYPQFHIGPIGVGVQHGPKLPPL